MPFFSIIIPCYNASGTIRDTLASLAAQTFVDWEVICVDDGSSDETCATLESIARSEPRLRLIRQANAGPSAARNHGAQIAKGQWLAFLDADDLWHPSKLASVADIAKAQSNADAVFGRIGFFRHADQPDSTTSSVRPGPVALTDLLGQNPLCTLSNLSVRRAAFVAAGGFDPSMIHAEDLEFLIRFVSAGHSLYGTDALHVRYRASDDGLSADLQRMHDGWRRAIGSARPVLSPADVRRAEAVHLRYLARRALRMDLPPRTALRLALTGMRRNSRAFLSDHCRGPATLAGCLAAPLLPAPIRRRAFCD